MVVVSAVAMLCVAVAILAVAVAGPVMLLWGAIAGTYGLPTMGFGTAIQVCLLASIFLNMGQAGSSNK